MDCVLLGLRLRSLRIRAGLRQSDLSASCRVSRNVISEVENGRFDSLSLDELTRIGEALGALVDVRIRWHGEDLDRLLDAAHSSIVAAVVERLDRGRWTVSVETSFSIWGERGSIDVLGWHAQSATLLVVEVKSVIPDIQAMLHDLDRRTRLAPMIARDHGQRVARVGRLLVVADSPTSRGRVRRQEAVLRLALPDRGSAVRAWLAQPAGTLSGLLFLSNARHSGTGRSTWRRQRVHQAKRPAMPRNRALPYDGRDRPRSESR